MKQLIPSLSLSIAFAVVSVHAASKLAVKTTSGSNQVTLGWDANAPEQQVTSYNVYDRGSGSVPQLIGSVPTPGTTLNSLAVGPHTFTVTAVNATGESGPSNEVSYTVAAPLPLPSAPTNLKVAQSGIANVSARAQVGVGENVLIAGLIITGEKTPVIVRAVGPTLLHAGINGALIDPTLELHNSQGELIAVNDNWQDTQKTEITDIGLAPSDYRESAISTSLEPGAYTAVLRGKSNTTGVALVEVYRG